MRIIKKLQEKNILRKIGKGDEAAFVQFYNQYAPRIYRFIYLKTNSSPEAEDLTSEAFLKLWKEIGVDKGADGVAPKGADGVAPKGADGVAPSAPINNPRAFLYQIARNLVIDYYRKKPRAELIVNEEEENILKNIPSPEPNLEEKTILDSDLSQIKEAISRLKEDYQDLILWRYLDDFSVKEIAQVLEKPEAVVRVQLHRAIKSLKKTIE